MKEFEETLADMGIRQWVRNKFVFKLREFSENKNSNVEQFMKEFNAEMIEDFIKISQEVTGETLKEAKEIMDKRK